jgi:hypothetical protein
MSTKKPLILEFPSKLLTNRPAAGSSYMIDPGDWSYDGALNANYRDVEAACIICNAMGEAGYRYNVDFTFLTCGLDKVHIQFHNKEAAAFAAMRLPIQKERYDD